MKLKSKKREIGMITIVLIIQTIVFIIAGLNKSYLHMDEAYSLGLANYPKVEIQENEDFYDTWHNNKYYEDYLMVNKSEKNNFLPVYENQKNDVHPPLYYLLLRIAMQFHMDRYSKWSGIVVNIILYLFITIFMYLVIKKLLGENDKDQRKSAVLALVSSITLASINNAIYIRMYALSTLNIVTTTYFHLKLLDKKENNSVLFAIGLTVLVGSLTHYYYLFYAAMLFLLFVIKYIREKEYKALGKYILTMILAGIISLLIFPYSIQHMFFGYRGQGAISNLTNISQFIFTIILYLVVVNVYVFNNVLLGLMMGIIFMRIYQKMKNKKRVEVKNKYIKYILVPTLFYFVLVALSSPWVELRYIMPVCGMMFILVFYDIENILNSITTEKIKNIIMICIFFIIIMMPLLSNKIMSVMVGKDFKEEQESLYASKTEFAQKLESEFNLPINLFSAFTDVSTDNLLLFIKNFNIEPEVLYSNKRNIKEMLKNDLADIPALYLFNSSNNRFLDDILLFANINESYIAKDIECTEEKIKEIMKDRDISNGMLLFINDGQKNEELLNRIKELTNLDKITYLQRLNACDVYVIK